MTPIIPIHRERILRTEEARILTVARQPGFKSDTAVAAQLAAYSAAEDLFDIHETYENHFTSKFQDNTRAASHADLKQKAHQLKLLALDTLDQLTRP
jgi:hypothetical protein